MYAGEVGIPRLLKLFAKYNIKTTWFIPGKSSNLALSVTRNNRSSGFCIPIPTRSGHSVETFPEQMAAVRDAGHEMYLLSSFLHLTNSLSDIICAYSGMHGYLHERQSRLTVEQQKDVLDRAYDVLTKFNNGIPPKGCCAPCWDTTRDSARLLIEKGLEYGGCVHYGDVRRSLTKLDRPLGHGSRVRNRIPKP